MTQYLLSVWDTAGATPPEDVEEVFAAVDKFNAEVQERGVWVFAGGLHPADTATVVRRKDGETTTTDGPFAESKEQIGSDDPRHGVHHLIASQQGSTHLV